MGLINMPIVFIWRRGRGSTQTRIVCKKKKVPAISDSPLSHIVRLPFAFQTKIFVGVARRDGYMEVTCEMYVQNAKHACELKE